MFKSPKFILAVIATILIGLQFDDDLDTETKALLELSATSEISSSWFYLLGMGTSENNHPSYMGRERYLSYIKAEALTYRNRSDLNFIDVPGATSLKIPKGTIHCWLKENNCFDKILKNSDSIKSELLKHDLLLERYLQFSSMRGYKTMTSASMDEVTPSFKYLTQGNRLLGLKALDYALDGDQVKAHELLLSNENNIRELLKESDNLLFSMILVSMLYNHIDMATLINFVLGNSVYQIAQLGESERSLDRAIAREFEISKNIIDSVYTNQEYKKGGTHIARPLLQLFLKPNMTSNLARLGFDDALKLSKLPAANFAASGLEPRTSYFSISNLIRNIYGNYLVVNFSGEFGPFIARVHDLDVKISLYNHIHSQNKRSLAQISESFVNPYYGEVGHSYVHESNHGICFEGPYENIKDGMCLFALDTDFDMAEYASSKAD